MLARPTSDWIVVDEVQRVPRLLDVVLHRLRASMHYHDTKGSLGQWATPSGGEVDVVWRRGA